MTFVDGPDERDRRLIEELILAVPDDEDFRMSRHMSSDWMPLQRTKGLREANVVPITQVLISKHQHLVAQKGPTEGEDFSISERLPQINPGDLGA